MKRDPVHRKIMKTRDAFIDKDHFDPDEALASAIKKRKFLLERMLEDRQHFPENDDNDEDVNAYEPYELKNELYYRLYYCVKIKRLKQTYCLNCV